MKTCWIITENLIGTRNQCIALAEAAGLQPVIKTIALRNPWKTLTPWLRHFCPSALTPGSDNLTGPWPDIIIASGRKAIAPALWVKKQTGNRAKLVVIQSPIIRDKHIDLVISPRHDQYSGNNVLEITGALSLITPDKLAEAKEEWRTRLETLPGPRLAVLIGGNSRTHRMTEAVTIRLADQLQALTEHYALMITASRRTPPEYQDYLRQHVTGPNVFFWDGSGDNPYRGFLAWADALIVTEDSVSMASEAISTGKPVYILRMEGGSARFRRFHDYLVGQGYARWFEGIIEPYNYIAPDDLKIASERIKITLT